MLAPHLNALGLPGTFRVGPFRIPIFGLFATAGLLAALGLSQRTAPKAGLAPQKLWDAGILAIGAAFVVSRLLLVVENFQTFRAFPMLVLSVPSLTAGGILLTAIFTAIYLRWQGFPLLKALDAWSPCAALLAAFLQLGHFFEGTDAGMPTTLPWGVTTPGDTVLGRVHPVQVYGLMVALLLTRFLYRTLEGRRYPGQITAFCMLMGGLASFLLAMFSQPSLTVQALPLETSQILATVAMIVGAALLRFPPPREITRKEFADILEDFANGQRDPRGINQYEALVHSRTKDPVLLEFQRRFDGLSNEFPSSVRAYCSDAGFAVMHEMTQFLKDHPQKELDHAQ